MDIPTLDRTAPDEQPALVSGVADLRRVPLGVIARARRATATASANRVGEFNSSI